MKLPLKIEQSESDKKWDHFYIIDAEGKILVRQGGYDEYTVMDLSDAIELVQIVNSKMKSL